MTTFNINGSNIYMIGHTLTIGDRFDYERYIEQAPRNRFDDIRFFDNEHMNKTIIHDIKHVYHAEISKCMPKCVNIKIERSKTDSQQINISVSGIPACNTQDYQVIKDNINNLVKDFIFEDSCFDMATDNFYVRRYYKFDVKVRPPTQKVIKNYIPPTAYIGTTKVYTRKQLEQENEQIKAVIASLPPPPSEWLEPEVVLEPEVEIVKQKLEGILAECLPESPVKPGMPHNIISGLNYNPDTNCFSFRIGF
jgi:hypothetical protein